MNVVIVEDEYLLAEELSDLLFEIDPTINVLATLDCISESVRWLSENTCDLIFLDVNLSDGLSFSIFEQVNVSTPIIFTTAFDSYAIKAFEVNSVDYLLKPIEKERLEKAIQKYRQMAPQTPNLSELYDMITSRYKALNHKKRFILTLGAIQKPVESSQVAYFMSDNKHLFAITNDSKRYFYDSTLAKLEEELDPKEFFRLSRKYYANINSVKELVSYSKSRIKVKLCPETEDDVIISHARANEFKKWLND